MRARSSASSESLSDFLYQPMAAALLPFFDSASPIIFAARARSRRERCFFIRSCRTLSASAGWPVHIALWARSKFFAYGLTAGAALRGAGAAGGGEASD